MAEVATIDELKKILLYIHKGHKVPKIIYDTVFEVAKREVEDKNKVVLIKRDPNIERNRIQAAYVKIIEGEAMDIHPSTISGFGADFDGDAMAVYAPISEEAQKEAKSRMISAVKNRTINSPNFEMDGECVIGLFVMTYEDHGGQYKKVGSMEDIKKHHVGTRIEFKGKKSTAGRFIFNEELPPYIDFIDWAMDKGKLEDLLSDIINKSHSDFARTVDNLTKTGFLYATLFPRSFDLETLEIPDSLKKLKKKLGEEKSIAVQQDIIDEMEDVLRDYLKENKQELFEIVESGASKGYNSLRQVMVCKGLISDNMGNVLPPITKSLNEGFTTEDYFNASKGSRHGIANRAHNTAYGGYAYRKAIFAVGNAEADINNGNCGTKRTFDIKLSKDLFKRMKGRYIQENGKIKPITEDMIGKVIPIRSPIYCQSRQICRTCYGELIKQVNTKHVGIVAAQEVASLSEKIMKLFHTGGAVEIKRVDIVHELLRNHDISEEPIIKKSCHQDDINLISDSDFTMISIDKKIYKNQFKIVEEDNYILLPTGFFDIKFDDIEAHSTIDHPVKIYKKNSVRENNDDHILLTYEKGSKLFSIDPYTPDPTKIAKRVDELFGGRSPWTTPESLFMKCYDNFSPVAKWDSVHLEVILSNILRWRKDPQEPARLKTPYDPVVYSLKTLPGVMSWPLGVAFENFGAGITRGLISDRSPESSIEKIFFGIPLIEEDKK